MKNIDENRDDRRVDRVDDQGANQGNDEERRRRRPKEFRHGCHIGDGVGRRAETEATDAAGHDGCFIIPAHDAEDDEVGEESHEYGLAEEHDYERHRQSSELPELEAHEDAGQENGQAQIAQNFAFPLVDMIDMGEVGNVADHRGDDHRADVARENEADAAEKAADQCAQAHSQEEMRHGVHEAVIVDGLTDFIFHLDGVFRPFFVASHGFQRRDGAGTDGRVKAFGFGQTDQMVFVDQFFADRTADDAAGDETECRRCDGNRDAAIEADAFQERPEGSRRTVAADHGDGARSQAHERTQVERHSQAGTDEVLTDDENRRDDAHFDDHDAAAFDQADTGRIADAGEEEHHADVLHRRILFIRPDTLRVENTVDDSKENAADDGSRDTVRTQCCNFGTQEDADVIDQNRCCQSLIDVELNRQRRASFAHCEINLLV